MVLVSDARTARPNGTLSTKTSAEPPVLSTIPTVTFGTSSTDMTNMTDASHFQPISFSGVKV